MNKLNLKEIFQYVEDNIGSFHLKRLKSLESKKLDDLLKRKNHYLFRAKNILTAETLVKTIYDAFLSSQEETLFGDFLENLAIFVCQRVYNGQRLLPGLGIDLIFEKSNKIYMVEIKSGPNWGNSSQISKMKQNFLKLKEQLLKKDARINSDDIIAVNGCCYGKCRKRQKDYLKLCGQEFWEFISGNVNLYVEIIEPLGHRAKARNDEFAESYAQVINKFTLEFGQRYCTDGKIDWVKLIQLISLSN